MKTQKPIITLNMDDKIYLAVANNCSDKLFFVYTLACNKSNKTQMYDMTATAQIHTFQNQDSARIYHDTIAQIVELNENDKRYACLFEFNKQQIASFTENIK